MRDVLDTASQGAAITPAPLEEGEARPSVSPRGAATDQPRPVRDATPGPDVQHFPGAGSPELVVLVDEEGNAIGTADKAMVHTARTPLHRAFSCYLFRPDGRLLVTRRALTKATFPGVWTNSVCGHPSPGEQDHEAIARRARHELGLPAVELMVALPAFRYRAISSSGIVENEICPVYLGRTAGSPDPDPREVDDIVWWEWDVYLGELAADPGRFSPWALLQAAQLSDTPAVHRFVEAGDQTRPA